MSTPVVQIQKIVQGGSGLARLDGKTVFVPYAAPGDTVEIKIEKEKKDYLTATVRKLISSGPERTRPRCPYYGTCGGCNLQHLSYPAQVRVKREIIRECLRRTAGIQWEDDIKVISAEPWHYRNRVQWKFRRAGEQLHFGFFQSGSHKIVDIDVCPLLAPVLNEMTEGLKKKTARVKRKAGEIEAVCGQDGQTATSFSGKTRKTIRAAVQGKDLFYSPETFFQCNRYLLEKLTETVVGEFAGKLAVDLYAGAGLFSLFLKDRFDTVAAVEENRRAVKHFRLSDDSGLINIFNEKAESWFENKAARFSEPDLLVMDPPRTGLSAEVRQGVINTNPRHIVYVSCNAATAARDLKDFLTAGYRLRDITALDMFPQTAHIESVIALEKN